MKTHRYAAVAIAAALACWFMPSVSEGYDCPYPDQCGTCQSTFTPWEPYCCKSFPNGICKNQRKRYCHLCSATGTPNWQYETTDWNGQCAWPQVKQCLNWD
jgi:hypothetical protein